MLAPATTIQGKTVVLLEDLPSIQKLAISSTSETIPYDEYRAWYLDEFYPNKALQAQLLIDWLARLIKAHPDLSQLDAHQKVAVTYIERKGVNHYYLRAKVYSMPDLEGCKVELTVENGQIIRFETLSYFPFERHHDKNYSYSWKSFLVLGKKDGEFSMYHPNGNIMQQGYFNSGKRVGLWMSYSPEGEVLESQIYGFGDAI